MGSRIRGITSLLAKRVAAKPALSVNGVAGPSRAFSLVSKRLPAPIGSSKAGETSRSTFQHPGPVTFRPLHTSSPNGARYERFDGPSSAGPSGSDGGGGGRPDFLAFFRRRLGSDRAVWIYGIGVGGAVIYYVIHLERVPETGRLRFIDVSEAQERELGLQTQLQTLKEYNTALLPPNHPISKRVRKVAQRIVESSNLGRMKSGGEMGTIEGSVPKWGGGGDVDVGEVLFGGGGASNDAPIGDTEWEVYVIDDRKTKNAFVLPGGKIFVFTGILPVSANDDGLATVLGHEVAHQVARHPAERMSYMKILFGLGFLLESLGLDVGITRLVLTFMLQLPNSRKSESEADFIGLHLMSRACFDPHESTRMWERMSAATGEGGIGGVSFLSTHPANAKRIKQLLKWMPEAEKIRMASPCGSNGASSQFGGFLDTLGPSNAGMGTSMWG